MRSFNRERLPFPAAYESFEFSKCTKPVFLEIGAGAGLHAIRFAKANPEATLLAVEHSKTRFAKLESRRRAHPQIQNLFCFHADAESVATHLIPDASLEGVFLLYPNPYPKASQANKRWHQMPFWGELLRKLAPGGRIEFATNEAFYAEEFFVWNTSQWGLQVLENKSFVRVENPDFVARTHFEKKYLERGERIFCITLTKL
jgi:tRNA (guanine-N(7)-)-methyltransferase